MIYSQSQSADVNILMNIIVTLHYTFWIKKEAKVRKWKQMVTWPLDGDAGLVFRSAHFAKYFTILSVKFESLCIRPIMSTKADKGDRKREIEQSPMKKKFRDSAISSEELDSAIASRIELAFKEHQSTLNSVVNSAVRDAVDSVLIPALRETAWGHTSDQ